ncbi:HAD hydrolase-like protein [Draconibacterium sp.]|nr:HAD hydrolase-like protein [Draconibacterium sp.]
MDLNFKSDIKYWLDNLEKLQPVPTEFCPNLKVESPVKAVIFDIYGTLLISSSGDINQASMTTDSMQMALKAGGFKMDGFNNLVYSFLLEQLPLKIQLNQEEIKLKGNPYPDVNIFKVWLELFAEAEKEGLIKLTGHESIADVIIVFELLSNKVYPMPGMKEVLLGLKDKGIPLGIVSNAQFYTPIIMNYFLTGEFSTKQDIDIFDPELSVFSYKELRAKPDVRLFDKIKLTLQNKYNLQPSDAIFVGNDMLKDVYTAKNSGLKTALFSGDKRSLRIRENDLRVKGIFPDFFINDLKQILQIIN